MPNIQFGPNGIETSEYIEFLETLEYAFQSNAEKDWEDLIGEVSGLFDLHEVYGNKDWGDVFLTSYYEPEISGSKKKTKKHSRAIYRTPPDMIEVPVHLYPSKKKPKYRALKGRLSKKRSKRGHRLLLPYYSRKEIDSKGALRNKNLEIAWADPIDVFFLQIQGSGLVRYKDGTSIRVGFHDGILKQNGHRYIPIGKYLTDVIPFETMTGAKIENHLRRETAWMRQGIKARGTRSKKRVEGFHDLHKNLQTLKDLRSRKMSLSFDQDKVKTKRLVEAISFYFFPLSFGVATVIGQ